MLWMLLLYSHTFLALLADNIVLQTGCRCTRATAATSHTTSSLVARAARVLYARDCGVFVCNLFC
jgi:hypothetical protein